MKRIKYCPKHKILPMIREEKQNILLQNIRVGIQYMPPPNMPLWYIITLSCRYFKNSKYRDKFSLNSPYLPKDRASKRNSTLINPLPGISSEKINSYHRRRDWKLTPHPDKNSVANYHTSHLSS